MAGLMLRLAVTFFSLTVAELCSESDPACAADGDLLSVENASSARALLQKHLTHGSQVEISENDSQVFVPSTDPKVALMSRSQVRSSKLNRSSSKAEELELDSAVSGKIFDDIADGLESVGDGFESLGDSFEDIGQGLVDAGLTLGTAVGNAATVVGNSVVESAKTTWNALPQDIKNAGTALGNVAVSVGSTLQDVGEMAVDGAVDLAGDAYQVAKHAAQEGMKAGKAMGDFIVEAGGAIGNSLQELGALAVDFAQAAWEHIKDFVGCLTQTVAVCEMLVGKFCDCSAGSSVSISGGDLTMKCVLKAGGLAKGYKFSVGGDFEMGDKSSKGRTKLPGVASGPLSTKTNNKQLRTRKTSLKSHKKKAPTGSCERNLEMALEGAVQFTPTVELSVNTNGHTTLEISGTAMASVDGLIEAEGSCAFFGEKRFPRKPIKKVVCVKIVCVVIMLQMVAEVEIKGTMTGTLEVFAGADFEVGGSVTIGLDGQARADFDLPSIKHEYGFGLAASASGSTRIGLGPQLVIMPMPGVPITINPMMNAEIRGQGSINIGATSLVQDTARVATQSHVNSSKINEISLCGAAALNIYPDIEIEGFALPAPMSVGGSLSTSWLKDTIKDSLFENVEAYINVLIGPAKCIPVAGDAVDMVKDEVIKAARSAADEISNLIPNLSLDFGGTSAVTLLPPTKLFCIEAAKTPGFDTSECSQDLGCKSTGRPPSPMVTPVPAQQVVRTTRPSAHSPTCHNIPMGDRFIQVGNWRLAAIDDSHFSISERYGDNDRRRTLVIFDAHGNVHNGPRADYHAWDRAIGNSKGIRFGFHFIQIGKFRIGAYDGNHLSISHANGNTAQIFTSDGNVHNGPRQDFGTWDRPESAASGIAFGNQFIQIGEFRIGVHYSGTNDLAITHNLGKTNMVYTWRELLSGPRTDYRKAANRLPDAWTCPSLEEMAHGGCDATASFYGPNFGANFIELGNWRLGAYDSNHFSISHKDGQTPQIFGADGKLYPGPRTDYNFWRIPVGFPYGIVFGPAFIQIGKFRLGMVDKNHFSISHQSGNTAQIFKSDGHLYPGPRTDFNLWKVRSTGPPSGITYGDRFLQIGRFRIGDTDGRHLTVTHNHGQTIQIYKSDGKRHPGPRTDNRQVAGRYPKWHCANVQLLFGTCTGITAGGRFLQFGDWRIGSPDGSHFSVSHRDGKTAQIFISNGKIASGPRTDYGLWHWMAKHHSDEPKFGDHFIQFGNFRIGQPDDRHLSISHKDGQTSQIWGLDGKKYPGPRTDFGTWHLPLGEPKGVTFGDRFVQIGDFRLGDVDSEHFSVSHVGGKTPGIFKSDGTVHGGDKRTDFTTFGRPLQECFVLPP